MILVAGYCRVSTDKEDQTNSFEAQKRYFRDYIQRHPGWKLHEIYADEGISGTTTRKRTQFNRMINDAYAGKFRMILTKEVSRFSRNILDTIRYTRELRSMGIGVIFATDRINTLEPEGEMLLSYLAAMAQEESRRTSARVVWGQTRQMEQGVVFGHSLLGYSLRDGVLAIEPEGARIVALIFRKYALEQVSASQIARQLTREGYSTSRGSRKWTAGAIIKILHNEKYVGDLVQKKTYTPDYLTHVKKANHGEVPMVVIRDHHPPIISREVWDLAQQRLEKNNKHIPGNAGHSNRYLFSGKIRCGVCGSPFVGRFRYRKDGTKIRRWSCATAVREGREACDIGRLLGDDDAQQMLKTAVASLPMDPQTIIDAVTTLAWEAHRQSGDIAGAEARQISLELERLQQKKEALLDSYFSGDIRKEEMQTMNQKYDSRMEVLRHRQQEFPGETPDPGTLYETIRSEVAGILRGEIRSDGFCKTILDTVTVYKDRNMELRLNHLPHVFLFGP